MSASSTSDLGLVAAIERAPGVVARLGRALPTVLAGRVAAPPVTAVSLPAVPSSLVVVHESAQAEVSRAVDGAPVERAAVAVGDVTLVPVGASVEVSWGQPLEVALAFLPAGYLRAAANGRDLALRPVLARPNPLVADLVRTLADLDAPAPGVHRGQTTYVDALLALLASHLVAFASEDRRELPLDAVTLRTVEDLVTADLSRAVAVEDLARAAGLSPAHFSRSFKASTGQSPYAYAVGRKMDAAAEILTTTDVPVTQVAFDVGYDSPSRFGAQFKRRFGETPSVYRAARTGL